jgi:hypothetical protein
MMEKLGVAWKQVNLHESLSISRVVGEYLIEDHARLPSSGYRIKVFERRDDFMALPNLRFRAPDGTVDGTCGLGATELEALQDAVARVGVILASRPRWGEGDLDWIDPRDF